MKFEKFWKLALGLVLLFWGAWLMGWIDFESAPDILGIGSLITGVLVLIDK